MSNPVRRGAGSGGGVLGYPSNQLHEEVASIALHFHWPLDQILDLEHGDRRRWVTEIRRSIEAKSSNAASEVYSESESWFSLPDLV
jgi:hypothetical protein